MNSLQSLLCPIIIRRIQKNIIKLYKDTSIFVYPSLAKGETFGMAVIEFMSFGAVPIVSGLECFKDFIRPNLNGMTFNHKRKDSSLIFANCLKILIENKKLRLKMAKQALGVRKTHSPDKIAKTFLSDFKRLTK